MSLLAILFLVGATIVLLVTQLWRIFKDVPDENRQFMDRPALGFRAIWPLINVWNHYVGHWYGQQKREQVDKRLRQAGAEYTLSAVQFLASKSVAALVAGAIGLVVATQFHEGFGLLAFLLAVAGYYYPDLWLRERTDRRRGDILRTLPFYLDIITLSVEAGTNLTGGMTQAVQKTTDSELRREFSRVLRDIRAGKTRAEALRDMAERSGSQPVSNVVSSLIQAEKTGASLGPLLRAQSDQLRSQRFQRAEKKALEAPVKLLGPLVTFIFPNTFLVLMFMIMSKAIIDGIVTWPLLVWAWQWPGGPT